MFTEIFHLEIHDCDFSFTDCECYMIRKKREAQTLDILLYFLLSDKFAFPLKNMYVV